MIYQLSKVDDRILVLQLARSSSKKQPEDMNQEIWF